MEKWHGTSGGYSNHHCRCYLCRVAWNGYCAGRKSQRAKSFDPTTIRVHGLERVYQAGCRCEDCRAEMAAIRRNRVARVSSDKVKQMLEQQAGLCACCGERPERLVVDHDHITNRVRGLLCYSCNTGIGKLGDSVNGLKRALQYLEST
jgi:hypothetical protein